MAPVEFIVDAVLFDMDGTLVDSIAAVEAAWGKVADDIGQDRHYVIEATHGKRAVDNLSQFKPHLSQEELPYAVKEFEESILSFADEYQEEVKRRSRSNSRASSFVSSNGMGMTPADLSPASSAASSRANSTSSSRRPSFGGSKFGMTPMTKNTEGEDAPMTMAEHEQLGDSVFEEFEEDVEHAWELEGELVDRSVQILPGVRRMIDSIPKGRYAVATSGAKTYAYGAMSRVGIVPPEVTITADDPRLKNGKPFPDPFILAAECLGFDPKKCVVFEDSPSGIRAGVASGAITVALCTSHERSKIENCGAHYLLTNMELIHCYPMEDGRLRFVISDEPEEAKEQPLGEAIAQPQPIAA